MVSVDVKPKPESSLTKTHSVLRLSTQFHHIWYYNLAFYFTKGWKVVNVNTSQCGLTQQPAAIAIDIWLQEKSNVLISNIK